MRVLDGQEVRVAPDRVWARLDPAFELGGVEPLTRGVAHLERTEALLADVTCLERIFGLTFFASKSFWRHMKKPPPGISGRRSEPPYPHLPGLSLEPDGIGTVSLRSVAGAS